MFTVIRNGIGSFWCLILFAVNLARISIYPGKKETPVHVYVRKNGTKKSAAKIRARSPKKKDVSPSRRPWIPAPGTEG